MGRLLQRVWLWVVCGLGVARLVSLQSHLACFAASQQLISGLPTFTSKCNVIVQFHGLSRYNLLYYTELTALIYCLYHLFTPQTTTVKETWVVQFRVSSLQVRDAEVKVKIKCKYIKCPARNLSCLMLNIWQCVCVCFELHKLQWDE